ncbi:G polyprotein [Dissostichus eleginoides]|uniref:G polyprotein n=1 Tax=Dissostichus eleginoides TaxID=100907 RepID=A0AAD9F2J2_DISEL|nr:G polyprotein [Dissostichus eleginoides]
MATAMDKLTTVARLEGRLSDRVAENHKHCLDFEFEDIPEDAGFHHTCYRRFTDKKAMTKVERRLAREGDQDVRKDLEVEPIPSTSSSTYRSQTEKLRSRSGLPIAGSGPVLPALCIICKMKEKMIIKAGKRQRDQLCKTETLSAGKLQKAAEKKDDQSVLIHIKDKDCVALEVRYHKSCYSQYTKFLLRPDKPETEQDEPMFDASYKLFCERIIRQRLLVNNEVLRMGQLRKAFIDMVKANEGVDASNYRQDLLKKRLAQDFPQLAFHMPSKRNVCELVFAETLSKDALVDMLPDPSVIEASPTEMSKVNTILKRSVQIADQLELDHIVLVFDQAIYAKAQQIRWKDVEFTKRLVIRLGEFHTCMSYLSILGKRFGDAGLQDILIESEVVAPGSINGHHYNRSMRAHKLLYESLQRIRFITFMDSLPPQERAACMDVITEMECAFPDRLMDVLSADQSDMNVKGQWTVQRQSVHGFASIACDQAIEQTVNRDAKTKGGWTGITQNRSAVYRWILSQHERSAIARQCESMAGISPELRTRKDLDKTRISADAKAVSRILDTIDSMLNPFDIHQHGVCLSSGRVATGEITKDLLVASEKGENAVKEFMDQRLLSKTVDIFAPIISQKLKTLSDQKKPPKKSAAGKEVILRADKKLFSRLLILGQSRKIEMREILSYSLGTVSYPLASADGSLAKTNKSALMDLLESKGGDCLVDQVPKGGAILFDGMAVMQAMRSRPATFGELAETILQSILQLALHHKCTRIDLVTDRYPPISIKSLERSRRADTGSQLITIFSPDQRTPTQWKKFLSDGKNKEALAEFLYVAWTYADLTTVKNLSLYIAHQNQCHCVTVMEGVQSVDVVEDLQCDHEEFDTRVFLHAQHAAQEHKAVIIKSSDTDVAVIAVSLQADFPCSLYVFAGTGNRTRIIDIAMVSSALGTSVCSALIGIHTFSGCDSTSAFYGKGLCCTDLCRCSNCANTKETEEEKDDCPDTDSEE